MGMLLPQHLKSLVQLGELTVPLGHHGLRMGMLLPQHLKPLVQLGELTVPFRNHFLRMGVLLAQRLKPLVQLTELTIPFRYYLLCMGVLLAQRQKPLVQLAELTIPLRNHFPGMRELATYFLKLIAQQLTLRQNTGPLPMKVEPLPMENVGQHIWQLRQEPLLIEFVWGECTVDETWRDKFGNELSSLLIQIET